MSRDFILEAPVRGTVSPLAQVPDRAFADEMLGPGIALDPTDTGTVTVGAPAAGLIRTIHPHAFVLQVSPKLAALVHLGIDTYRAGTDQFKMLIEPGRYVNRMEPIIEWNIDRTVESKFAPWVVVTILGFHTDEMSLTPAVEYGDRVCPGQQILQLHCDQD
ncbi:PTS glucose transporter subunit IIA [Actinomyces sp. F1_1611]